MSEESRQIVVLPDRAQAQTQLSLVREFQATVKALFVQGHDFGVIPGTDKPTLLKPGAEKLAKLLQLADSYDILDRVDDWDKPLFRYVVRCELRLMGSGTLVASGLGECNSMESRYRWRNANLSCPECGKETVILGKPEYGGGFLCWVKKGGCGAKFREDDARIAGQPRGKVLNDDVFSQVNTILKMAKKRALVDAALSAGRLSDIFTQDIEDLPGFGAPVEGQFHEVDNEAIPFDNKSKSAPGRNQPRPTDAIPSDSGLWASYCAIRDEARTKLPDEVLETLPVWDEPRGKAEVTEAGKRLRQAIIAASEMGVSKAEEVAV